jgi:antitoxin MazE
MKSRLIQIGNSRGVRLPKLLIEEAGLKDEVEIIVQEAGILIAPIIAPRAGWSAAAQELRANGGDELLDPPTPTQFDEEGWAW